MTTTRTCEVCGKQHESNLIVRCPDCMRSKALELNEIKIKTESLFRELALANGWLATKRGYPDFICYRGEELVLVEVKRNKDCLLSVEQSRFMNAISSRGIKCKVWRPSDGFIL